MNKKTIKDVKFGGFAAQAAKPGEKLAVTVQHWTTSDSPIFYVYAEQLDRIFFPGEVYPAARDLVNRYLAIIHADETADVYWDDFNVVAKVKVNRAIAAGEAVYAKDLDEVAEVRFPEIAIKPGDRIVYLARSGWRFGIYFDLTEAADADTLAVGIAKLQEALVLDDVLARALAMLTAKDDAPESYDAFIITEGKTDSVHLAKAFGKLKYARRFEYSTSDTELGADGLLEICRRASHLPHQKTPVICTFDRDNPEIAKQLRHQSGGVDTEFQSWGNNVFSMMLPRPRIREGYENISIEMYYPDDVLKRTIADGRRLVFDNELKMERLPGGKPKWVVVAPDTSAELTKKVYCKDVDTIVDESGRSAAISKTVFAEMIREERSPFTDVSFESFGSAMGVLEKILAARK